MKNKTLTRGLRQAPHPNGDGIYFFNLVQRFFVDVKDEK